MSSEPLLFDFRASVSGMMADYAHLTLYNGFLETELKGYGKLEGRLPAGLYRLVAVLNEQSVEKPVRLDKDVSMQVDLQMPSSSVPAAAMANNHEYYSDTVKRLAYDPTTTKGDPQAAESLFIFFRYADEHAFARLNPDKISPGEGFLLLDQNRKKYCELSGDNIEEELTQYGWLAFHIKLSPGTYYLYYNGRKADKERDLAAIPARELPLTVFERWQTQCFMTFGKGPDFRTWFVSLREGWLLQQFYRPEDNDFYDVEGLLQKFANGIFYLSDRVLNTLTNGKWQNPILGLLAAYAYFHSGRHDRDALFRLVVDNSAERLLPGSPDAVTLRLAASVYLENIQPEIHDLQAPGMFLTGLRTVLREKGYRIVPGSIAEQASDKLLPDMFWTSYTPISRFRVGQSPININIHAMTGSAVIIGNQNMVSLKLSKSELPERNTVKGPKRPSILNSWVASSLLELLLHPGAQKLPLQELAGSLRVTPHSLEKTIMTILEEGPDIVAYLAVKVKDPAFPVFTVDNMKQLQRFFPKVWGKA